MPDGGNKLARIILLIAGVAAPVSAALFFRDHPVFAAVVAEVLVLVTAFLVKVWDKLETQWVDAAATWFSPKIEAVLTRYRARYRRCIYFQHRTFDVKGLNTQGAFSLELDQVFVELALSPEAPHKISADPLHKPDIAAGERREIWDFLKNDHYRHLAILGAPGSGKTTLLKHIALALAGPRRKRPLALTPVLLYLRDIQGGIPNLTLAEAIRQSLPRRFAAPAGWVENELENKRCLILLDGLDEVADTETRKKVARWVDDQIKEFNDTRFIVTSRPNGYLSNPLNAVTVLDVKPFTWPQVERFAKNWYLATETVRAGKRDTGVEMQAKAGAQDLLKRLGANPALTDLAVNPLLLTMVTTVHKERNSLPGRRVELYHEICDVFLGKRQASKGIALDLTPAQKRRVLEPWAWHMMERNLRVIKTADAASVIAPVLTQVDPNATLSKFLASVRDDSGLIVEQEKGEYAFAHLTFQEYLASVHAKAQGLESVLVNQVNHPWWAETIRLYAAQNDATSIVLACVAASEPSVEALALALDCRDEGLQVGPDARRLVDEIVIAGLDSDDDRRRRMAAEVHLVRYIQSMVRVAEDTYVSQELVPNVIYELFARESAHLKPPLWTDRRFPKGEGNRPVTGVTGAAAKQFCRWLSGRSSAWSLELPAQSLARDMGPHWVEKDDVVHCDSLPTSWIVLARQGLLQRLGRKDYSLRLADALARTRDLDRLRDLTRALARDRLRALDHDLARDFARDFARALDHDRLRALDRALFLDIDIDFDFARTLDHASDFDTALTRILALARAFDRARALARDRNLDLAATFALALDHDRLSKVEALTLLLMCFVRSGSASEAAYADVFLASAIALEQQAGNIPPHPAGIALIRRRGTEGKLARSTEAGR